MKKLSADEKLLSVFEQLAQDCIKYGPTPEKAEEEATAILTKFMQNLDSIGDGTLESGIKLSQLKPGLKRPCERFIRGADIELKSTSV